jgi:Domain of unknown function (DUF4082)
MNSNDLKQAFAPIIRRSHRPTADLVAEAMKWRVMSKTATPHAGRRLAMIACLLLLAGSILHLAPSARAAAPSPHPFQSSGPTRSVWSDATVPGTTDTPVDSSAVELGMKFRSSVNGYITGVRFYKGATNTGVHVGNLWSSTGTRLATAIFTNETASGWQEVSFTTPVQITADTTYVVSYHTNVGHYAFDGGYFATAGVTNSPLHALADGEDGANGVYQYGAGGFPIDTFNAANYWVDVAFITTLPARSIWNDTTVPGTTDTPVDSSAVELGLRFRAEINGYITGVRFYKGATNTGTHIGNLWTNAGTLLATTTFTNETASGWQEMKFATPVAITANTTYVVSYHTNVGHYAFDSGYFTTSGVTNSPLRALANGEDGANGVFKYGAGGFPTDTFNAANYWVDVAFITTLPARSVWTDATVPGEPSTPVDSNAVELGMKFRSDVSGYVSGVRFYKGINNTGTHVGNLWASDGTLLATATFADETASGWQEVSFATPVQINANTTYVVSYHTEVGHYAFDFGYFSTTVASPPLRALADGEDGPNGVYQYGAGGFPSDTYNASNYWVDVAFTTTAPPPPPPPPDNGPGGPVLIIVNSADSFGRYYGEILRAEGLNAYHIAELATVSATTLASYDVAILSAVSLTDTQAAMFGDWVNGGGNLIAMRPDKRLASLLGLTDANATLSNAYLLVNTASGPGAGIVNQTMQFHSTADLYTLDGATGIATLYSNATTATANPAVTLRNVGTSGGQAVAFTYDLARSIVYTRQGNPAWVGQERDGITPMRSDDLFFGAAAGDAQPDWVDLNKVAIPQADEQQRLLIHLIETINSDRKPLPRFWYFPRDFKAVVIMTGDDHGNGGTAGRFDTYKSLSPVGCSVDDWECVRATSYIFTSTPFTDAQAAAYNADGFEVGLHVNTNCDNWTPASLESFYANQLSDWSAKYTSLTAPVTNRTHCITWSDWASQPLVELQHGIRLDTNYYYWPGGWVQDRPGFFTGSGMPMRFANLDGAIIDVYQATTQMTDESDQSFPFTISTLLDRALGAEGYYGAFTANMHTDSASSSGSDAIVTAALQRGVPVIAARQMLKWLDGRNQSAFGALAWSGNSLSFTVTVGAGANGLTALLPLNTAGGALTVITRNGVAVSYTTETIKGVSYAVFAAAAGSYQANYGN